MKKKEKVYKFKKKINMELYHEQLEKKANKKPFKRPKYRWIKIVQQYNE
jgi:hypothetical protein